MQGTESGSRWGILLIVCKAKRQIGWKKNEGAHLQIGDVIAHLQRLADQIASKDSDSAQMAVKLIDVSDFSSVVEADGV